MNAHQQLHMEKHTELLKTQNQLLTKIVQQNELLLTAVQNVILAHGASVTLLEQIARNTELMRDLNGDE